MRALVTRLREDTRREKVLVNNWPDPPAPVDGQLKVQTLYSGLANGGERHDLLGGGFANRDEDLPRGWGCQNVGRVVAIGPKVQSHNIGDIVFSDSGHVEFAVFDENALCWTIPPEVDPAHAALFGVASIAMHTCRNADIPIGEQVLIVGAGLTGQVASQIVTFMGARATLCDSNPERLEIARKIAAPERFVEVSGDGWKKVMDMSYDVVIDLAGAPVDHLIAAARPGGRVMLVAWRDKVEYSFKLAETRGIIIRHNSNFDRSDVANVCRLAARKQVEIGPLVRDIVPVADAHGVYETLRDEPRRLFGTVFKW